MDRSKPWIARVQFEGKPGTTAVNINTMNNNSLPICVLTSSERQRAKDLWPRVGRYAGYPSQTKWLDAFAYEATPSREIAVYERIAWAFELFIAERQISNKAARRTVVQTLIHISMHTVDIPSQVGGITDELVDMLRSLYQGDGPSGIVDGGYTCSPKGS